MPHPRRPRASPGNGADDDKARGIFPTDASPAIKRDGRCGHGPARIRRGVYLEHELRGRLDLRTDAFELARRVGASGGIGPAFGIGGTGDRAVRGAVCRAVVVGVLVGRTIGVGRTVGHAVGFGRTVGLGRAIVVGQRLLLTAPGLVSADRHVMEDELVASGRFVRIETRGQRTGLARPVTVGFVDDENGPEGSVLVAAGSAETAWAQNLLVEPSCRVTLADRSFDARAEPLGPAEHARAIRGLIIRYGTPAEGLGHGPSFRLSPVVEAPA
jgi:deazaflavin-dependent oxidoreductase (nitroreductase family)